MKKKQKADTYRVLSGGGGVPEAMGIALQQLSHQFSDSRSLLDLDVEANVKDVITVRLRARVPDLFIGRCDSESWLDSAMKKITELVYTNCASQSIELHWSAQGDEESYFEISGFLQERIEK